MKIHRFTTAVELPVPAARAWAWHERVGAFERLAPPWQRVEIVERPASLYDGARLVFRLRSGPLALRWVAEHREVTPGRSFVDVQLRGPFASWKHRHELTDATPGSVLTDTVEYALPGGPLGDRLARRTIERDLRRLFAYRQATLVGDLELHSRYSFARPLLVLVSGSGGLVRRALSALLTTGGHQVVPSEDDGRWPAEARRRGADAWIHFAGTLPSPWLRSTWSGRPSPAGTGTLRLAATGSPLDPPPATLLLVRPLSEPRGERPAAEQVDVFATADGRGDTARRGVSRRIEAQLGLVLLPPGPARRRLFGLAARSAAGGTADGLRLPWISLDDAIGALLHLLATSSLDGAVELAAPTPVSRRELAAALAEACRPTGGATACETRRNPPGGAFQRPGQMHDTNASRHSVGRLAASGFAYRHPEPEGALRHALGRSVE